jgi:hypothetical protein
VVEPILKTSELATAGRLCLSGHIGGNRSLHSSRISHQADGVGCVALGPRGLFLKSYQRDTKYKIYISTEWVEHRGMSAPPLRFIWHFDCPRWRDRAQLAASGSADVSRRPGRNGQSNPSFFNHMNQEFTKLSLSIAVADTAVGVSALYRDGKSQPILFLHGFGSTAFQL